MRELLSCNVSSLPRVQSAGLSTTGPQDGPHLKWNVEWRQFPSNLNSVSYLTYRILKNNTKGINVIVWRDYVDNCLMLMSLYICGRYCTSFVSNQLDSFAVGWLTSGIITFPGLSFNCPKPLFLLHQYPPPSPPQRKRIGAMTFRASCCPNSIQIPNIWNGSLAIFLHGFLGELWKRIFLKCF